MLIIKPPTNGVFCPARPSHYQTRWTGCIVSTKTFYFSVCGGNILNEIIN